MSRSTVALASLMILAACGGGGGDSADPNASAGTPSPSPTAPDPDAEVIIQLRPGIAVADTAARYGLTVVDQFGKRPIYRLSVPAGTSVDAAIHALRADSGVRFAERNVENETPESRRNSVWAIGGDAGTYAAQWAPTAMRLAQAHSVSTGSGVRVAILDTGIDLTHPELASRLARTAGGQVQGRDLVDDDANPQEAGSRADLGHGHGTHVAGLVALAAPGATLMPARVLDAAGRGNAWVLAEGLGWAVDPDGNPDTDDGAHVINLSLGTPQQTTLLQTVTRLANCEFDDDDDDDDFLDPGFDDDRTRCASGRAAVVVSAAGNSGNDIEVLYPAAEPAKGALAVTASAPSRQLSAFANFGSWIGIAAPGDAITSTVPGGGWGVWSGTSMAAPLAAGTAALVMAIPPTGGDPARPVPRQWVPEFVVKRLTDRSATLCETSLRQIDAAAAVQDVQAPDFDCP